MRSARSAFIFFAPFAPSRSLRETFLLLVMMADIEQLASIAIDTGLRLHRRIGPGLLESAYELLLLSALERQGLEVKRQWPIAAVIDGVNLAEAFRADLLIENRLIIELKSVERLAPIHTAQLLTYLRLLDFPLGLLMNFGGGTFREGLKRVVNNYDRAA